MGIQIMEEMEDLGNLGEQKDMMKLVKSMILVQANKEIRQIYGTQLMNINGMVHIGTEQTMVVKTGKNGIPHSTCGTIGGDGEQCTLVKTL